jgi:hypothetical protein
LAKERNLKRRSSHYPNPLKRANRLQKVKNKKVKVKRTLKMSRILKRKRRNSQEPFSLHLKKLK